MTEAEWYRQRKLQAKKAQYAKLKSELPHKYGFKWYQWAWNFYTSRNRMNLICASNQSTKSSSAIRKHIEWATNKKLWKELWPDRHGVPNPPRQFWYLYPQKEMTTSEFQNKWVPEFMPKCGQVDLTRGKEQCIHPIYGWKAIYDKKYLQAIHWSSGIITYFKTYSQDVHHLQGGSVHYIVADEELPEELYDELMFRLQATDGFFDMVFTATRNQLMWLLAMEGKGTMEKFPQAFKQQISMYDCRVYMDGSPGQYYDEAKIEEAKQKCKSEAEIQRRIYGRFIADKGRKYPAFDASRHFVTPFEIPHDWHYYGGLDYGSGGKSGHPTGMGILAVQPDYKKGYIIDGWRGDGIDTSSGDAVIKFLEIRGNRRLNWQCCDPKAKDCISIAERMGEGFLKAENSHEIGEQVVNTLFANDMLFIFDTPELQKLGTELLTVMHETPKKQARDDFIDGAVRYPCAMIPWDWTAIKRTNAKGEKVAAKKEWTEKDRAEWHMRRRRGEPEPGETSGDIWPELDAEINFWNELYE